MRKASDEGPAGKPPAARTAPGVDLMPLYHALLLTGVMLLWYGLTRTGILPTFFFGQPALVLARIWGWFLTGSIFIHLGNTLLETALAFASGTALGLVVGLWLALDPFFARLFDPYIKAINSMPRLIFAPIFAMWFGLGIWSKVALGVTLVFFIVFFNTYQGILEVDPNVINNARVLGARKGALTRHVLLPSAVVWILSSLHTSVGFALVGAVVGEYLGASRGLGYVIQLAEGTFDSTGVFSGMLVLAIVVIIIDLGLTAVENRLLVWKPQQISTGR